MNSAAFHARRRIEDLKCSLAVAEAHLSNLIAACQHTFGPAVSEPIVRKGYTEPGDTPGTMGIDFRSSFYVPEQRTPRWTRTCRICGKVEETFETVKTVTSTPSFSFK